MSKTLLMSLLLQDAVQSNFPNVCGSVGYKLQHKKGSAAKQKKYGFRQIFSQNLKITTAPIFKVVIDVKPISPPSPTHLSLATSPIPLFLIRIYRIYESKEKSYTN